MSTKQSIWAIVLAFVFFLVLGGILKYCSTADKAVEIGFYTYEHFHNLYGQAEAVGRGYCDLSKIDERDSQFKDFSRSSQMNAKKSKLNEIVSEYNANSRKTTRDIFKGSTLPQTLTPEQFIKCD